jgi:AraC family transcriptional regulator
MNGWIEGIQNAIEYIENNLTEELKMRILLKKECTESAWMVMEKSLII